MVPCSIHLGGRFRAKALPMCHYRRILVARFALTDDVGRNFASGNRWGCHDKANRNGLHSWHGRCLAWPMSSRACDPSAVDDAELDLHASAYSAAGAMRAGFELYRAFDRDSEDNRVTLKRTGELAILV